jgi:hypothetical protein
MVQRGRIDPWSLLVAAVVLILGIAVVWHGASYRLGTAAEMGSGFYPVLLGILLTGMAMLNLISVAVRSETRMDFRWRPLLVICLSLCAFAYLVRPFGLIPATFALVLIACMAEKKVKPLLALFTAATLSFFGTVIFIYGLNVPLAAVRW